VRFDYMEAAGVQRVHQHEARGQVLDQKPETECLWLSFGGAAQNGGVG
jgi:hypothetical protein